jgi:predicted acyltransferase
MAINNERFQSLDVFRGLTVCFMIIVNSSGWGAPPYGPLDHAEWFGFTPTDLVFPSFLFAVGNALSFSKTKYNSNSSFLWKVFKRTLIIFLLGYLMYWFPFFHRTTGGEWVFNPISHTRILGVLQRIALCYGIGALLVHYLPRKALLAVSVGLLLGYWALLYLLGEPGQELTMLGNAGTKLDVLLLGNDHLYHQGGGPIAFDPEGILSTLPSLVNVIGGYLAGIFIQQRGKNFETIARLLMVAAMMILLSLLWAQFFPLAKKLWTSSFVLLTVGLDLVILSLLIYAIEIKQWKKGMGFFLVFGKNPLAIYLLSELLFVVFLMIIVKPGVSFYQWINQHFFQALFPGSLGSLAFAVSFMLLCWLVGYWLHKKSIYLKI